MPLILAIEPDRRQAAQLSVVVRKRVHAELILVDTTEQALDAIGSRMPDLVLVPALLSPQDDAALATALRVIAAAACVQMLTIPVLGAPRRTPVAGGMLSALRRGKPPAAEPDGCDPAVFADQIASYLERAASERPQAEVVHQPDDTHAPAVHAELTPVAALDDPAGTLEDRPNEEWLESLEVASVDAANAEEPDDESVSVALEEAVRGLFANPVPEAVVPEPSAAHVEPLSEQPTAVAKVTEKGEWLEVDELMAALKLMPLAAMEITDEAEWIAPVLDERDRSAETPHIAQNESDDAALTKDVKAGGGKSEREWVTLIESLRHDVERLRVERSDKPARKAAAQTARPDRTKPVQDEWGLFDPEQCGFAALLAKLDEVTESEDSRVKR